MAILEIRRRSDHVIIASKQINGLLCNDEEVPLAHTMAKDCGYGYDRLHELYVMKHIGFLEIEKPYFPVPEPTNYCRQRENGGR